MVYQIQKTDIKKAAQVLGRSFVDYPIFKYVLSNDQYRKRKITYLFLFIIKLGLLNGEVIASSKEIEGVSIWINPSSEDSPLIDGLKAGIISLLFSIDSKSFMRFCEIGSKIEKIRSDILKDSEYLLLDAIGVDPQFQRQGFARLQIESKLNIADKTNTPCYLETSNRDNIYFYEKFGFSLFYEYELFKIKTYCLYRKPNTVA